MRVWVKDVSLAEAVRFPGHNHFCRFNPLGQLMRFGTYPIWVKVVLKHLLGNVRDGFIFCETSHMRSFMKI